jgi:hypothetical protein
VIDEHLAALGERAAAVLDAASKAAMEALDEVPVKFVLSGTDAILANVVITSVSVAYDCTHEEAAKLLFNLAVERQIEIIRDAMRLSQGGVPE